MAQITKSYSSCVKQSTLPVGGVCADGGREQSVHDDVGVAADGRGEVGVDGAGQPVVHEQRLLDAAGGEVHGLRKSNRF